MADIFLTVGGRGNAERETLNGKLSPGGHLNYRLFGLGFGLEGCGETSTALRRDDKESMKPTALTCYEIRLYELRIHQSTQPIETTGYTS